jgi:hypothetical protein
MRATRASEIQKGAPDEAAAGFVVFVLFVIFVTKNHSA